jgi:hypothetical protein
VKRAADLKPGDRYLHYVAHHDEDVIVTVLDGPTPTRDRFGRDMLAFTCRREDTGDEGLEIFGPGGVVRPA